MTCKILYLTLIIQSLSFPLCPANQIHSHLGSASRWYKDNIIFFQVIFSALLLLQSESKSCSFSMPFIIKATETSQFARRMQYPIFVSSHFFSVEKFDFWTRISILTSQNIVPHHIVYGCCFIHFIVGESLLFDQYILTGQSPRIDELSLSRPALILRVCYLTCCGLTLFCS